MSERFRSLNRTLEAFWHVPSDASIRVLLNGPDCHAFVTQFCLTTIPARCNIQPIY